MSAQSTAIIEYIEELFPTGHSLLPKDPVGRARARAIAQYVVCEIQPLQNTRVDSFLKTSVSLSQRLHWLTPLVMSTLDIVEPKDYCLQGVSILAWKQHWIKEGLEHLEKVLESQDTGRFCQGDSATIADCCLVPQVTICYMSMHDQQFLHCHWKKATTCLSHPLQVFNACHRYGLSLEPYPALKGVYDRCLQLAAVQKAWPDRQPDYDGIPPT